MGRSVENKGLPRTLLAMAAAFAAFPLWSLSFANPLEIYLRTRSAWQTGLTIAVYWLLPLAIVGATLKRSLLLLPLFMLECGALLVQSFMAQSALSPLVQTFRHVLLAVACGAGFLLMSREMVFPLLKGGGRRWRAHPRVYANRPVAITSALGEAVRVKAMLENVSLSGVLISAPTSKVEVLLARAKGGDSIRVEAALGGATVTVEGALVWHETLGPTTRIGMRSASDAALAALVRAATPDAAVAAAAGARGTRAERLQARLGAVSGAVDKLWAQSSVRVAMMSLWAAAVVGTVWIPSCGRDDAIGLASISDVPEGEAVFVELELESGEADAAFGLTSDPYRVLISIEGCASGHGARIEWVQGTGAKLPIPIGDTRCVAMVIELKRGKDIFLPADKFNPAAGARNKFRSGNANELTLVNVAVLPKQVTADVSIAFAMGDAKVAKGDPVKIEVVPPAEACVIVVRGDPMGKVVDFEVRVHPIYLPSAKRVTFYPCGTALQWKECSPEVAKKKEVEYKNEFTKKTDKPAPYAVAAEVEINNPHLRKRVEAEGKSLFCGEVYYAPR